MTDFWLAAGPIALAVAGYMISQELGRIRKELHEYVCKHIKPPWTLRP
jgi:hypothetical protein